MTFAGLILHNVLRRRLRAVVAAIAVAIGVTGTVALDANGTRRRLSVRLFG